MKVTARYAHGPDDTPGTITLEGTEYVIKVKARSFVEDGFRNQTWMTVDFGDHTYSVRNVHGVAETQNVEHNSGGAMNEFQSMFLTEPQPSNSAAFLLAEEYNARCEAYDQKVCTGPTTRDGIQPADARELGLISLNARAVIADVTIKALEQGVTVDELRRAISKLP